jgi:allantoin racemase
VFPGTPYERGLCALGYVEAGIRAQDTGCDGVFINTFGDYGIDELKSALRIPVVGAGEAAMALATTLGRRFAIVTIWPTALNFIFDERIRSCGMTAKCAGVFNVMSSEEMTRRGTADDPVAHMRAGQAAMIARIVEAAEVAVQQHGADTVVLGCTCMAPIGHLVAARLTVPVVEPMTAGYKLLETQLSLGLSQSMAAFPPATADKLALARNLVAGAPSPAAKPEDCEVCEVAAAAE